MTGLSVLVGIVSPTAATASEEGRRNTALALGAVTGYLFTRGGNKVPAFAGLAATAYAYKKYDDSVRARHERERYYGRYDDYYGRYDRNRYADYSSDRYCDNGRRYYRHDSGKHKGWYKAKHKKHRDHDRECD
jgi:hypothetical protein